MDDRRPAWSAWYQSRRWRKRSKAQLREHPLCKSCLQKGIVVAAKVTDHVVAHKGNLNLFWLGDLQSLCHNCHSSAKQSEEARGYSKEIGPDGWPVDRRHPAYK